MRLRVSNPRMRSIFDDFLESYQDVKKTIFSNPVKIEVKPLPFGKPSDFCGVAGSLNMSSSISTTKLKANEAVTVKVVINGNGNLKMIQTPEISFPQDFEIYDPKVENSFVNTSAGVKGTKTIEYLVIPRYAGKFEIPSTSITYFDLSTKSYKTLKTNNFTIEVEKGEGGNQVISGNFTDKEQLKLLGSDVRYLKKGYNFINNKNLIFEKSWYWFAYILLIIIFAVIMVINRKKAIENADITRVRNKKASKVAVRRLRKASQFLKDNNKEAFYDEVLKALW